MGVDYRAYAVIGVRVSPEKLVERTSERACGHPLPEPMLFAGAKFCPECGRPAFAEAHEYPAEVAGFRIVWGTDHLEAVVAYFWTSVSEGLESSVALGMVPEVGLDEMRDKLASLGLWDEAAFGLHAVLYCSY